VSNLRVGETVHETDPLLVQVFRDGRPHRAAGMSSALVEALGEDVAGTGDPAVGIPMTQRSTRHGVLVAADEVGDRRLGTEDLALLEALAASAATAVTTARSVAADRLRHSIEASERERGRWARELHDETLQGLGALQVLLSAALRMPNDKLADAVRDAVGQIGEEIRRLRVLITELRPAALDDLGLVPAIETLAQRTATGEGLLLQTNIELGLEEGIRLDTEVESALYRLAQEALTNLAKHAGAKHVEIRLSRRGDDLELCVRDDGIGFDPSVEQGGFGLVGMRERVALVGGRLEIDSAPGQGTTLRAILPMPVSGRRSRAQVSGEASARTTSRVESTPSA
jgi:signal transduction histidine kinase